MFINQCHVNLNNASNMGNMNTGSTDMGLLNAQSCSDNPLLWKYEFISWWSGV